MSFTGFSSTTLNRGAVAYATPRQEAQKGDIAVLAFNHNKLVAPSLADDAAMPENLLTSALAHAAFSVKSLFSLN